MGALCICTGKGTRFVPRVFEPTEVDQVNAWLKGAVDAWITGNPIKPGVTGRPEARDVESARWLLLDADPRKRAEDPKGLSESARIEAHELAEEAYEALGRSGILIDSGRGAQLWIRVEEGVPRRRFLRFIAAELGPRFPWVTVDATHDLNRLMRLPGSVNSRTGRTALILAEREGEPITQAEAEELMEGFVDVSIEAVDASASFDPSPPTAVDLKRLTGDALRHWNSEPDTDRSLRDFILLRLLLSASCPEDVACRLLYALPGGKANDANRDGSYWGSTLQSVYKTLAEESARRERLDSLLSETEEDAAAPFASQALEDLAWMQRWDTQGWQRMRSAFKELRRFKLSDLERDIGKASATSQGPPDDIARCIARKGKESYWLVRSDSGWLQASHATVQAALRTSGEGADVARNAAARSPWEITSVPFAPLWLEGRRYNVSRAQWRIAPAQGPHPMWRQLLTVVGRGLDAGVEGDAWCKRHAIADGAAYLFAWLASLAQQPERSTAYLFCFSAQENIGKSMLHEAVRRHLLAGGVVKADKALTSERGFNAELEGSVLCIVEEANLGRARNRAHERLKDHVTGDDLALEGKGADVRDVANYTHWYQTANSLGFCPLFRGDTRITAWEMQPAQEQEKIEKPAMHEHLATEAPAFLDALLAFDLPKLGDGRLAIPAVNTEVKRWQQDASRNLLDVWVETHPLWISMGPDEIVVAAQRWLSQRGEDVRYWRTSTILRGLPSDESTLGTRKLVKAMRESAANFRGTAQELVNVTGCGNARSVGRVVSRLEKLGVPWCRTRRSNGIRLISLDSGP